MWYGGTLTIVAWSSPALPNSREFTRYEARFRWRSTAALGSPVVPLVNSRTAVASGSQPQPSVSSMDSSSTVARKSARSMISMPVDALEARGHPDAGDHDRRRGPLDDRAQPVVGQAVVDRHEGLAGDGGAEQRDRTAGEFSSISTTWSPGWAGQPGAGPAGAVTELAEGEPAVEGTDGHPVAEAVGGHLEDHPHVHGRTSVGRRQGLGALHQQRGVTQGEGPGRRAWCRAARSPRPR